MSESELRRYVVVRGDGTLRNSVLYRHLKRAERECKYDGDCVVEVEISLQRPPIFIRRKTI